MYRKTQMATTSIKRNSSYDGETIEAKINRIVNNKEPITDGAPLIYTDRKDGVQPAYDIRTDRWEIAVDAMDKVAQAHHMKRELAIGERTFDTMTEEQQTAFNKKYPTNKHNKPTEGQSPVNTSDNK